MAADAAGIKKFISLFMSTMSTCSLYSMEHPSVDELVQKVHSSLNEVLTGAERLEIMIVEDQLIINKTPVRDIWTHGAAFIKRLKRRGISRVDFVRGITSIELKQLIADMLETDNTLKTLPHIKAGVIDVRIGGSKTDVVPDKDSASHLTTEQIERAKEAYHNFSPFRQLNMAGLEEIVVNFVLAFRREANILKLISPVKSYSDYTYTHATNVAVLTMFQAESLGVKDKLLQEIGIAALLHDVGKLFVPKEILDKQGKLDEKEWAEIQRHTLYGAKYLAKIDGLVRIAPIVAMEHHMKYDGLGYPRYSHGIKAQHICSQIVSIADFFDALRSKRPYKKDWEIKEIIALMKQNAGKDFNPFLVDHFSRIIMKALN